MGLEEKLPSGVLLTTLESVVGYARKFSVWPATFGLARPALYGDHLGRPIRTFLSALMLLAGLILLAACVNLGSLSRTDLYGFAFVFLGLFFILSSFADIINWIHYFTLSREDPRHDPRIQSFYQLTRPFLTLAAGLISLLGAPRWTKKLVSRDQKGQAT